MIQTSASKRLGFVVGLILALSLFSHAQNAVSTGSMTGVVRDPSGNVVVNAAVVAVNEATGERVTSTTNGSGTFSFPP